MEIKSSLWSVGCEYLDRDFGDINAYNHHLLKTGAKHARFQSGWGTTVFARLPLWDSPILLAERGQVELVQ